MKTRTMKKGWRAVITSGLVMLLTACGGQGKAEQEKVEEPDQLVVDSGEGKDTDGEAPSSAPPGFKLELPDRLTSPSTTSPNKPEENSWKKPQLREVALEGEEAPGTGGQKFRHDEFQDPQVNDKGNVGFVAEYGEELNGPGALVLPPLLPSGEGVFFWHHDRDLLVPVALTGQSTSAGLLSGDFDSLELNKQNQLAFVADVGFNSIIIGDLKTAEAPGAVSPEELGLEASDGSGSETGAAKAGLEAEESEDITVSLISQQPEALIQARPLDDRCEGFALDVIARSGNAAPGGGIFWDFDQLSQNDHGEIAFEASYFTRQLPAMVEPTTVVAQIMPLLQEGIFLWLPEGDLIIPIARAGDRVHGTNGLRLCRDNSAYDLVRGPWMNKNGDITFIANCFEDDNGVRVPALEGSMVISRPGEPLELFLAIGSPGPLASCNECDQMNSTRPIIKEILVGRRGINESEQVFRLKLTNGFVRYSVVATKSLDASLYSDVDVCATEGQDLGKSYTLELDGPGEPTISSCGTIAFEGDINGWEYNYEVHQDAIFTCKGGELTLIAHEGQKMPVGEKNEFDDLDDPSNSSSHVVFTEDSDKPTGVFLSTSPYKK